MNTFIRISYLSIEAGIGFMGASRNIALESWVSLVHFHMFIVICSLSESLATTLFVTYKGSLSCVDSNMVSEVVCFLKIS